jgi:hypothetical protein
LGVNPQGGGKVEQGGGVFNDTQQVTAVIIASGAVENGRYRQFATPVRMQPGDAGVGENHAVVGQLDAVFLHQFWPDDEGHGFGLPIVGKFRDKQDHRQVDAEPFTAVAQVHFVDAHLKVIAVWLELFALAFICLAVRDGDACWQLGSAVLGFFPQFCGSFEKGWHGF